MIHGLSTLSTTLYKFPVYMHGMPSICCCCCCWCSFSALSRQNQKKGNTKTQLNKSNVCNGARKAPCSHIHIIHTYDTGKKSLKMLKSWIQNFLVDQFKSKHFSMETYTFYIIHYMSSNSISNWIEMKKNENWECKLKTSRSKRYFFSSMFNNAFVYMQWNFSLWTIQIDCQNRWWCSC